MQETVPCCGEQVCKNIPTLSAQRIACQVWNLQDEESLGYQTKTTPGFRKILPRTSPKSKTPRAHLQPSGKSLVKPLLKFSPRGGLLKEQVVSKWRG